MSSCLRGRPLTSRSPHRAAGPFALAAAFALALAAGPLASAQAQAPATVTAQVDPLEGPVPLGDLAKALGRATYTADAVTPRLSLAGITISYTIVSQPEWATVVVSPPSDVIEFDETPNGTTASTTSEFEVSISRDFETADARPGEIVIEVYAHGTTATAPASTTVSLVVEAEPLPAVSTPPEAPAEAPSVDPAKAVPGPSATLAILLAAPLVQIARRRTL